MAVSNRSALILGIGGQDGYFMTRLLLRNGYRITGVLLPRNMQSETMPLLRHENVRLVQGSICNADFMGRILRDERPDHIYNFAGISFVAVSWQAPAKVAKVNGLAVSSLLALILEHCPQTRFFQAGSSEMFGHSPVESPQNEDTPFNPDNPYASSKVFATHITRNMRSNFGLFAVVGILYNHESQWRPPVFVTRKIARAAAAIKLGLSDHIELGNIESQRDWSYAGDIVDGIWLMMNAPLARDYVLASGQLKSVRDCVTIAFRHVGLRWEDHVRFSSDLRRSRDSNLLCGNSSRVMNELGWKPRVTFKNLIETMVDAELSSLSEAHRDFEKMPMGFAEQRCSS